MRTRSMLVFAFVTLAPCAFAQEYRGALRAVRVQVKGDLTVAHGAAEFAQALDLAHEQQQWALVELGAHASDPAVVHEFVRAAKERACKMLVVVPASGAGAVDPACLALALVADGACIEGSVTFATASDKERPPVAEKPDPAVVAEETRAWLAPRFEARGVDPALAAVIVGGPGRAHVFPDGRIVRAELGGSDSSPAEGLPLRDENGVTIGRAALERLHVSACGDAKDAAKALGFTSLRVTETVEIDAGVAEVSSRVASQLDSAQIRLALIAETLQLPDPDQHQIPVASYRSASDRALQAAEMVADDLEAVETLLRDAPEVMRLAPPGEPVVEKEGRSYAGAWRALIKSRRSKLERLKTKAEAFAAVR